MRIIKVKDYAQMSAYAAQYIMSQVLLSFGIALALVPLLIFTSNKHLMGELVNTTLVKRTGWVIVVVVVALNLWLLIGTALGL